MKTFGEYLSAKSIIFYLCRTRAKLAKTRNKKHIVHLLSTDKQYNYHRRIGETEDEEELQKLLPNRKKWKKLGKHARIRNGHTLNSVDKNIVSLQKTINFFQNKDPKEDFLTNLEAFIASIQDGVRDDNFSISTPDIYPKPKDKKASSNICRPISLFSLKDKIIISLTNKFFTYAFDKFFYEHSYAFRARRKNGEKLEAPTHHDAIYKILEYKKKMGNKKLWVAECDMMKFYDTVNHSMIKHSFRKICNKFKRDNPAFHSIEAEKVFFQYLNCYTFNKSVLPLNISNNHFSRFKLKDAEYGWVKDELLKKGYYKSLNNAKIGIPQGGALSGLIANIVLHEADKEVLKGADKDLLYIRYCDDMIIMHPNKKKCQRACNAYKQALKKLKLIPHDFNIGLEYSANSYWKAKSKPPYKWTDQKNGGVPWIGFVGYEIHYEGYLRIRKSSLKKEMEKQHEVINQMRLAIKNGKGRANPKTIEESVTNRLIGMSVGRVKIWNFKNVKNDMCWINGFVALNNNKYSAIQLKKLDRCRNRLLRKFRKELDENEDLSNVERREGRNRNIVYYGKPFSYYYQVTKEVENNSE